MTSRIPRDHRRIAGGTKAVSRDPEDRFGAAAELEDELRRYLESRPIRSRPIGAAERFWRWCRRSPVVASLSAGVVLALLLGTVVASIFAIRASRNANDARTNLKRANEATTRANLAAGKATQEASRADLARAAEGEQRRRAEDYLYPSHIALANHELSVGNVDRVALLLSQCPQRLRRWEWHYLRRQISANLLTFRGHQAPVRALVLMPDGRRAATGDESGAVLIWDLSDGRISAECTGREGPVMALAFRPDGRVLASAGRDATVRVWDPAAGRLKYQLRGHLAAVPTLAFSADGKHLASGGWDGLVKVWDVDSGHELRTLSGCRGWVTARFVCSHEGHYLAASSWKYPHPRCQDVGP